MSAHELFYYPYASFADQQLHILKVAALYFDKLTILDPVGASWVRIGADHVARDAVELLRGAGLLHVVKPAEVLQIHEQAITAAVRRDMADSEFLDLCSAHAAATGRQRWSLALAKVPMELQADQVMRHLMGDFAREVAKESGRFSEASGANPGELNDFAIRGQSYDESREGYGGEVEYRFADFPLALGESIMMNHALFTGLLYSGAAPVADDPFHSRILAHKLKRISKEPVVHQAITDRAALHQLRTDNLALAALTDRDIKLPVLDAAVPIAEILDYRQKNPHALAKVREKLARMTRRIESEPWTADFAKEIDTRTLPDLIHELADAAEARDAWLKSSKKKTWFTAAGITVGAATAVLGLVAAPVTPIALVLAGLGVTSASVIPGAQWLNEWREGKTSIQENGLHYLLRI